MTDDPERARRLRWRLVLGAEAADALGEAGADAGVDEALAFLYDRERGRARNVRRSGAPGSGGGTEASDPRVAAWIADVRELFPRSVAERLERDALERYELLDLVTDAEVLARATPSMALLKAILATKHLMDDRVLAEARRIIRVVVEELRRSLARPVASPFAGTLDRRRRSHHRVAANFDARATVRANLRHVDARGRLVISEPLFSSRVRRQVDRWQVVVLVDQSGSMADNVIHAAVTAAIFTELGGLMRTHLVAFDTSVVDLTQQCSDPVEVLLGVQLGGGTDIAQAVRYAAGLLERPRRSIVVLISDFEEGGSPEPMLAAVRGLVVAGATVLALGALSTDARPSYDEAMGRRLAELGAHVGTMTPDQLAAWVAERVRT